MTCKLKTEALGHANETAHNLGQEIRALARRLDTLESSLAQSQKTAQEHVLKVKNELSSEITSNCDALRNRIQAVSMDTESQCQAVSNEIKEKFGQDLEAVRKALSNKFQTDLSVQVKSLETQIGAQVEELRRSISKTSRNNIDTAQGFADKAKEEVLKQTEDRTSKMHANLIQSIMDLKNSQDKQRNRVKRMKTVFGDQLNAVSEEQRQAVTGLLATTAEETSKLRDQLASDLAAEKGKTDQRAQKKTRTVKEAVPMLPTEARLYSIETRIQREEKMRIKDITELAQQLQDIKTSTTTTLARLKSQVGRTIESPTRSSQPQVTAGHNLTPLTTLQTSPNSILSGFNFPLNASTTLASQTFDNSGVTFNRPIPITRRQYRPSSTSVGRRRVHRDRTADVSQLEIKRIYRDYSP